MEKKEKKFKKKDAKTKKIIMKLGQINLTESKMVESILKNHETFFISIGNYRDTVNPFKLVKLLVIFGL